MERRNKKCIHARTTENGSKSETEADPCSLCTEEFLHWWPGDGTTEDAGERKVAPSFIHLRPYGGFESLRLKRLNLRHTRELALPEREESSLRCSIAKEKGRKEVGKKRLSEQDRKEDPRERAQIPSRRQPRTLDELYSGGRKTPGTTLGRSSMRWPRIADDVCWPPPPLSWGDFQFSPSSAQNEA